MIRRIRRGLRLRTRARGVAAAFRDIAGGSPPPPPPPPVAPRPPSTGGGLQEPVRATPRGSVVSDYRVNLLVSSVAAGSTFGGVQTAVDLFRSVAAGGERRRIISVEPLDAAATAAFPDFTIVDAADDSDDPSQLVSIASPGATTIPVGPHDVFIATFWPTAAFVLDVRRWQGSTFGAAPARFAYLIQDFEPAFYPRSAQSLLARATYDDPASTIAIFNTSLLQGDFHDAGIRFSAEFAFEPRLSPALREVLDRPHAERSRRIVVYGRPSKPRNAFALIVDGLRVWRAAAPDAERWSIVSAGERHVDIDLGGGVTMEALGKLALSDYADLLQTSAIGISLMLSPHPSYPPLEMAHLGLLVLTNRFGAKDLSSWHTNITSMGAITERGLADDLGELCRRFDADPTAGDLGRLLHRDYVDIGPQFPFADEVAALLRMA
jgi:O-antigen biosynthesis protein